MNKWLFSISLFVLFIQPLHSQDCPMMNQSHEHENCAMGFDQNKTMHHFRLQNDGGEIEVRALQKTDQKSIHQIQIHLAEISKQFKNGDFSKPQMVHSQLPPGSQKMKEMRSKIEYKYEELPDGGRVRIRTKDPEAIAAIHEFLKFQIGEHRTGDSKEVGK